MSFLRIVLFAIINLRRRLQQHWLFWGSSIAGVALVGIGSGVAATIAADPGAEGIDFSMATAFLAWCAIVVAGIHGAVMLSRLLQNDMSFFRLFFAFGFTPMELVIMRGTELFMGLSLSVIGGVVLAWIALNVFFGIQVYSIGGGYILWCMVVGYFPLIVLPPFLGLRRLTQYR